jgi:L-ascorbate metabolism protein UlaG (beta-lactamase superfamily)
MGLSLAPLSSDISVPARTEGSTQVPVVVFDDGVVQATAVAMTHGRAIPALAYRLDTADGSVVFSGDTTVNYDLIALAQGADILVHHVADLGYLERHGTPGAALERMAALHTDVTEVGGHLGAFSAVSACPSSCAAGSRSPAAQPDGELGCECCQ